MSAREYLEAVPETKAELEAKQPATGQGGENRSLEARMSRLKAVLTARKRDISLRIILACLCAVGLSAFFLLYDALPYWELIGHLRVSRFLALLVVSVSLSAATVVFQAVTRNRILSPSVMGFDAMFSLIVTGAVFFFTSDVIGRIPTIFMFGLQTVLMILLAVSLFTLVLGRGRRSVHALVLIGIVVGSLLRAITTLMVSVMDPNEFLTVQNTKTASFAIINMKALYVTLAVMLVMLALIFWRGKRWDLLTLGEDMATNLGLNYRFETRFALSVSSVLVACATALVGPLMFFGLLIVNIALFALQAGKTRQLLPMASAIGVVVLVGGQAILEHLLNMGTILPVVIEFVGGLLLLLMIFRQVKKA